MFYAVKTGCRDGVNVHTLPCHHTASNILGARDVSGLKHKSQIGL